MKYLLNVLLTFSTFCSFAQEKKCLLILLDGIPADVLEKTHTPNIDKISKTGGYARAYVGGEKGGKSESPTSSAIGYNSMLTGTWANKHKVYDNSIDNPNYSYPTIFKIARDNNPLSKLAIYSTWEDNRMKLLGENLVQTNHLKIDIVFDGYEKDTLTFPHDKEKTYIKKIDELVVNNAAESIKKEGPDLSWVYLEFTDDIGHLFGDSPQMTKAVELMDKHIEKLYNAIIYREQTFKEEWLFILTTDHGRDAETGKNHGKQSDRERTTWMVTNQSALNNQFTNGLAIVDIFPSVAQFMGFELKPSVRENLDGVSFLK